ncbi:MAG: hypothetical protein ACREPP_08360, partial [Rhodanobacteraceae bacterium]
MNGQSHPWRARQTKTCALSDRTTRGNNPGTHSILGRNSSGGSMRNITLSLGIAIGASALLSVGVV